MRKLLPIFVVGLVLAVFIALEVDISRLYRIFQPVVVCLSIMAAAIFVRLNRGLPTLEWKSLTPEQRIKITSAVLGLAKDYVIGLILTFTSIALLVILSAVTPEEIMAFSKGYRIAAIFSFSASLLFSLIWMAYVIWRDYDIVRLQKTIIDAAADRETRESNNQEALKKREAMKASGLKSPNVPTTNWPE
ncbi:UNVERIFIED_ORG: hypothetical protein J2740_002047 [Rhizobium nepotum]|jgi:hypothetical protein|nr:hypothetical protein [Rhizobium nepotum]